MSKIENTAENKSKFFALYLYQTVFINNGNYVKSYIPQKLNHVLLDKDWWGSECYLELTPLSQITQEDAVALIKLKLEIEGELIGVTKVSVESIDTSSVRPNGVAISALIKWEPWADSIARLFISEISNTPYQLVDELRRRGYYVGDGTEIDYEWVKLKKWK